MNASWEQRYARFTDRLSPELAGRIDLLRPSLRTSWGGPLNGQLRRREILQELGRSIRFDRVIETGTYRGTSTGFLATSFGAPVVTIEANPRHFTYSRRRLASQTRITVLFGDSRSVLLRLADAPSRERDECLFAYLDAHWEEDLPLAEELEIIASGWARTILMIDDFQVVDDDGYAYDDYGPGRALTEDYLPAHALEGWSILYPTAESAVETGATRGCCVLASPEMAAMARIPSLRFRRTLAAPSLP